MLWLASAESIFPKPIGKHVSKIGFQEKYCCGFAGTFALKGIATGA